MADKTKTFEKITNELFSLLETKVGLEIKEEEDGVAIQFTTDEPGILIGYHGQALQALQLLIAMIGFKKNGEWTRVLVNVGDYREKREESLTNMAKSLAQKVKFSGTSQSLPPMSSAERRIIHLALADDQEVETVSESEGRDRHVVIKPKV
jgi:spoIIIJ-associated protein